ncbi:MAG: PHP domain-containing protein, partial [Candidatus Magasanikbacteria bacterium]|nr:PHP domain-containing protein [Candidatus Magasanikbacteria bacterium]
MKDFVHLHVHSHYSLLEGLAKVPDLVKAAKKRGFSALALTDHGNMYGAIEFYQECEKNGLKPIIGTEVYLAPKSHLDKDEHENYSRLVLLAIDNTGYHNLIALTSIAQTAGFHLKPRIDKELLKKYHSGIVALSGGFDGEIVVALRKENNLAKAKKLALEYREIFGEDNFYLELMDLPAREGQTELNSSLIALGQETGVPLVVTRDV